MVLHILISLTLAGVTGASWTPMNSLSDKTIRDFDFDSYPLEIKTDSKVNSGEELTLVLLDKSSKAASKTMIIITFGASIKYKITSCMKSDKAFPNGLPDGDEKIWRFTKTPGNSEVTIQIHCNNVEVLNAKLSTECNEDWTNWKQSTGKMNQFGFMATGVTDTASDAFRTFPGWRDIKRDTSLAYDLTTPLEVWTNKEIGKTGTLEVRFEKQDGTSGGGITINFKEKKFALLFCSSFVTMSGASKISSTPKIIVWRFTVIRDTNKPTNVIIHYNDEEVTNVKLDSKICSITGAWKMYWENVSVKKIKFVKKDDASNGFRPYSTDPSVICPDNQVVLINGDTTTCDSDWYLLKSNDPADWLAPARGSKVDFDLETTPLEIKTTKTGNDAFVFVMFYSASSSMSGGVVFKVTSPPKVGFVGCDFPGNYKNFPVADMNLAADKNNVWRVTVTRTSGVNVQMHCNDKEVLNYKLSDNYKCADQNWNGVWSKNTKKIGFQNGDSGTDFYRAWTGVSGSGNCKSAKGSKVIATENSKCGTTVAYSNSHVTYQNKATCGPPTGGNSANGITRSANSGGVVFRCSYLRTGTVANPQWAVEAGEATELGGEGTLEFALKVFDSAFNKVETSFPLTLELNSDIHMELSVDSTDTEMSLHIVEVKAITSATDLTNYAGPVHFLFQNGCAVDSTTGPVPISPDQPKKKRFKFKVFKFVASNDNIYIHAKVKVCGKDKASCTYSCNAPKRKRRAAAENKEDEGKLYSVTLGPFISTDPMEAKVKSGVCKKMRYNLLLLTMAPLPIVLMN